MQDISNYNPLKVYRDSRHLRPLYDMLSYVDKPVCFSGDEVGYFFCPLRRLGDFRITFNSEIHFNFFLLMKKDAAFLKRLFNSYMEAFDISLLRFYETKVFSEFDPYVSAYYTMILSLLSENINSDFCNYIDKYDSRIHESVKKLITFNIENNDIYWREIPEECFVVSFEGELNREGILITSKETEHKLLDSVDDLKYYYVR